MKGYWEFGCWYDMFNGIHQFWICFVGQEMCRIATGKCLMEFHEYALVGQKMNDISNEWFCESGVATGEIPRFNWQKGKKFKERF